MSRKSKLKEARRIKFKCNDASSHDLAIVPEKSAAPKFNRKEMRRRKFKSKLSNSSPYALATIDDNQFSYIPQTAKITAPTNQTKADASKKNVDASKLIKSNERHILLDIVLFCATMYGDVYIMNELKHL